jgi:hypothetical protein
MTLRLSLVIEGDAGGAKKALADTSSAIEDIGRKAEETKRKLDEASKGFSWNDHEFDRARNGLKETADEGSRAAESVDAVADAGAKAAPEIAAVGQAAEGARGGLSGVSSILLGMAGGLAAAAAVTAIGAALRVAAGAAGDLFREITSNEPAITRALEGHRQLVQRIKGAWAEAQGAASSYGLHSVAQLRFESQQNVGRLEGAFSSSLDDLQRGIFHSAADAHGGTRSGLGPLQAEVRNFREELRLGEADVLAFRQRISEIAEAEPSDSPLRGLTEQMLAQTKAAAELQAELARSRDLLDGLKGDAEASATALGGKAEKYQQLSTDAPAAGEAIGGAAAAIRESQSAAESALPALQEYDALLKSIAGSGAPIGGSAVRGAVTPLLQGRGFSAGGFTGHGPADQVAGFVHGGEFVFDAAATARIGVSNLEAIRGGMRGYATGGAVGQFPAAPGQAHGGGLFAGLIGEVNTLQGSLYTFGQSLMRTGKGSDALAAVFNQVTQRLVDRALRLIDQIAFGGGGLGGFGGLIGGLLGGGGGASLSPAAWGVVSSGGMTGLFHGGGVVGQVPSASRWVPDAVFAGAPRLHGGGWLKPGERPVIAKDGEEIGWPDQLARKYGGAGGLTRLELSLSADLEARILEQAAGISVEVNREADAARRSRYRSGGEY